MTYEDEKAARPYGRAGPSTKNLGGAILHEDINNKKVYYFKASDIGKALGIVNIHSTIQNYEDEDERVIRKAYDPKGTYKIQHF
jgi:hypothetical protein